VHSAVNDIVTASLRHTVNAIARDQSRTMHSVHSEHTVHSAVNDIVTASLRHTVNAIARDQSRTVHSAANDIMPHFIILARFSTSSCGFATCIRHAFDFFVENLVANLLHQSRHVTHVRSSLGFKQVCSWLSTRSRKSKARFAAC